VYWRRRAVVAGVLLVVILLIAYSCSGGSGSRNSNGKAAKKAPPSASAPATPTPSASVLTPTIGESGAGPGGNPGTGGNAGANHGAGAGGTEPGAGGAGDPAGGPCTDGEITVVPAAETPTVRQGVPTKLIIKIKNISGRTCARDVGANMQELYIQQDATKQWSSDACERRTGNDVVTFPPNHERSYWLVWDGKTTAHGCTNRPWLPKGSYQLFGRLGTKVSESVPFTVSG